MTEEPKQAPEESKAPPQVSKEPLTPDPESKGNQEPDQDQPASQEVVAPIVTDQKCPIAPEGLAKLYSLERCEVETMAKRCGPGDACMIDCYLAKKGEGKRGGCYNICDVYQKGWSIPPEWASCR